MEIGELARRAGVRASAIRHYEAEGLIAPEMPRGNRRVFGEDAVERLALIAFAKEMGFTLDEIRTLLAGFPDATRAGERWARLAATKLEELDAMSRRIETMRAALQRIAHCGCADMGECAEKIAGRTRGVNANQRFTRNISSCLDHRCDEPEFTTRT